MLHKVYSIRDSAAEIFHPPFFKGTHLEAERNFKMLVNEPRSETLYNHPEHFDLYYLGTYDSGTGKIQSLDTPEHMVKAAQLRDSNHATLKPIS